MTEKRRSNTRWATAITLAALALLSTALLVGCGPGGAGGVKSVITVGFAPGTALADAKAAANLKATWEKAAGNRYTIEVHAVMGDNFPNAMLQSFASGQGFDVFEHWGPVDCKLAGITIDMTSMVQNDWPDYKKGLVRKDLVDLWNTGGTFIMLPKEEGWKLALIYRSDWLKTLAMQPPRTIDEFKAVAYAMTKNDPDGNKKNDTYGFVIESDCLWNASNVFYGFGGENYFKIDPSSGLSTIKGYLDNDAFKKEITLFRDMFKDKVLNPNSFIVQTVQQEFEAGKTGMFFMDTAWIAGELDEKIGKDNWDVVPAFNKLHNGGASIGISTVAEKKGKAQVKAAWEVLKAFYSPEVQLTLAFGPEGEAWTKEGGKFNYIKTTSGGNITGNIRSDLNLYEISGVASDPKMAYHAQAMPLSGGHLNWLPNREKIERRMDGVMGKVATGAMTPDQAIDDLNTFVDAAFKEVGVQ
jgi:maltose-binding protein MalE